jgi:two-component system LytT family response regulator
MKKYRVLIVDDEDLARELLLEYLKEDQRIEVVGECSNGLEGLKAVQELHPDLIFLDIQMPKVNGFEMLELLTDPPEIVFSTAFDQFAIRAFEMNAVDYLLKPYPPERLRQAVDKAIGRIEKNETNQLPVDKLVSDHDEQVVHVERIVVKSGNKIHVIPASEIRYIESQDDYVMIYWKNEHALKQKTMKYFETHLDPRHFIRVHRSFLVNVSQISEIQQYEKESWILRLSGGEKLKVSKSGYRNLRERLSF